VDTTFVSIDYLGNQHKMMFFFTYK